MNTQPGHVTSGLCLNNMHMHVLQSNHEKTEIIPFGSEAHQTQVATTHKLGPQQ